ncbi:hypothetical protein DFH09DRAFT_1362441 [Mycena vulgaris]|nr:hypothetical protein DFH09DRAFT_1362441 [Mycena vulgaris]
MFLRDASTPISPAQPSDPESSSDDDDSSDSDSINTSEFLERVERITGFPPVIEHHESTDSDLGMELFQWTERQMEREAFTRGWDSEFGGEPLHRARETIYGNLRHLIDWRQMAAENLRELSHNREIFTRMHGSNAPDESRSHTVTSDTSPDPTQSPTSLDFSMETPAPEPQVSSSSAFPDAFVNAAATSDHEGDASATSKRRREGSGASSADRPRKRFREFRGDSLRRAVIHKEAIKAAHILEPTVLGSLAFARRALLEGAQRIEDILVREKCDFRPARSKFFRGNDWVTDSRGHAQPYAEFRRTNHPLLFDSEAAKLHILAILLRERRYFDMGWALNDLLRIKFRDEYAIAYLLGTGYLDFITPISPTPSEFWDQFESDSGSMEGVQLSAPAGGEGETAGVEEVPDAANITASGRFEALADNRPHSEPPLERIALNYASSDYLLRRELPRTEVVSAN